MFTKRHEQELAEIKALTHELGRRFETILEELESIKRAQDELAARDQQAAAGKRGAGRARTGPGDDAPPTAEDTGAKRDRRRQPSAAVAVAAGAKGKRRGKAGGRAASESPQQGKRGRGRKQQRQSSEAGASSNADEG